MNKISTLILLFICQLSFSQNGPYWLLKGGGTTIDEGLDISIDGAGNTYTTGYFSGTAQFGPSITLSSSGITDIFIAKTDPLGNYVWVEKAGGMGPDKGLSIKTDASGNSYITGYYQISATFGSTVINSVGNSQDIFLAKYNSLGILQWVKSAGGPMGDIGNSVNIDNLGNVYITGQFSGTANFGSNILTSMIDPITGTYSFDVFTAKYNASNGNIIWVKKGSASHTDRGIDLACDPSGNIYVTGQFSDTITFDQTHYNNMSNSIFLIKYDPSGVEQWFRYIGGSTQCISYGLTVDQNSNVFITGDFLNQLIFFGSPNYNLTNTYPQSIFVAKYDPAGNFIWANSDGSNSEVTARNIAVDDSSNTYVTGSFKCRMNQWADVYGQGSFNSVGYWDVFAVKYNGSGNRIWVKQSGGLKDDQAYGIAVDNDHDIIVCGGFYLDMYFPGSADFTWPSLLYSPVSGLSSGAYCNDIYYHSYYFINSTGSADIFICKGYDLTKTPYDYYIRPFSANCITPYIGVEIENGTPIPGQLLDTMVVCDGAVLNADSNTESAIGPQFNYLWSTSSTSNSINVSSTGLYFVTQTSDDGCFVSMDSIYFIVHPKPPRPIISDSRGININALNTNPIYLCLPDSVILTAGNICSGCTGSWVGTGTILSPTTIRPTETDTFIFTVTDSNGCSNLNSVYVQIDSILTMPYITSELIGPDTVTICLGQFFNVIINDNIVNNPYPSDFYFHSTIWSTTPYVPIYTTVHAAYCYPTQTGLYTIYERHTIMLQNHCSSDTVIFYDTISVYAIVLPGPYVTLSVSGNFLICPGDTTVVTATTNGNPIQWTGPGIIGASNQSSVSINAIGFHSVTASIIDSNGCTDSQTVYFTITNKPSPTISMNPPTGLICPNDSVILTCNSSGSYSWYGPNGSLGINNQSVTVNTSGMYFCVLTDTDGCVLTSNTVEVLQYNTPYLIASPSTFICPGETVTIEAITNPGSTIQWQPPLSGSSPTQAITAAGTYTCNIISCGIMTQVGITITASTLTSVVTTSGPLNFCSGDSVILYANSNASLYHWSNDSTTSSIVVYQPGTYTVTISDLNGCSAASASIVVNVTQIDVPVSHDTIVCYGSLVTLHASATGNIQWFNHPSGGIPIHSGPDFITPSITANTTYYVQTGDSVCTSSRVPVTVTIYPGSAPLHVINNSPVCSGDTLIVSIDSVGPGNYSWTGPNGFQTSSPNFQIANAAVLNAGTYTLIDSTTQCGDQTVSIEIVIYDNPLARFDFQLQPVCEGVKGTFNSSSQTSTNVEWHLSNGYTDNQTDFTYIFNYNDSIDVMLIAYNHTCKDTARISPSLNYPDLVLLPPPNVFTPNYDNFNDCFQLKTDPGYQDCYQMEIFNRWGRKMFVKSTSNACWDGKNQNDGKDCAPGVYYYIITIGEKSYTGSVTLIR
jgi:gliding motility-associated-like protein